MAIREAKYYTIYSTRSKSVACREGESTVFSQKSIVLTTCILCAKTFTMYEKNSRAEEKWQKKLEDARKDIRAFAQMRANSEKARKYTGAGVADDMIARYTAEMESVAHEHGLDLASVLNGEDGAIIETEKPAPVLVGNHYKMSAGNNTELQQTREAALAAYSTGRTPARDYEDNLEYAPKKTRSTIEGKDERFDEPAKKNEKESGFSKLKNWSGKNLKKYLAWGLLLAGAGAAVKEGADMTHKRKPAERNVVKTVDTSATDRAFTDTTKADEQAFVDAHTKLQAAKEKHTAPTQVNREKKTAVKEGVDLAQFEHDALKKMRAQEDSEISEPEIVEMPKKMLGKDSVATIEPHTPTLLSKTDSLPNPAVDTFAIPKTPRMLRRDSVKKVAVQEELLPTRRTIVDSPQTSEDLTIMQKPIALRRKDSLDSVPLDTLRIFPKAILSGGTEKADTSGAGMLMDRIREIDREERQKGSPTKAEKTPDTVPGSATVELPSFKPFPTFPVSPEGAAPVSRAVKEEVNPNPGKGKMKVTLEMDDQFGRTINIDSLEKKFPRFIVRKNTSPSDSTNGLENVAEPQSEEINEMIFQSYKNALSKTEFFNAKSYEKPLAIPAEMYALDKVAPEWYLKQIIEVPKNLVIGKNENIPQATLETIGPTQKGMENFMPLSTTTANFMGQSRENFNFMVRNLRHERIHAWQRSSADITDHVEREVQAHYFDMFPDEFSEYRREHYKIRDEKGNVIGEYPEITASFPTVNDEHMFMYANEFEDYYGQLSVDKKVEYRPMYDKVERLLTRLGIEKDLYAKAAENQYILMDKEESNAKRAKHAERFEKFFAKLSPEEKKSHELMHEEAITAILVNIFESVRHIP